MDPCLEVDPTSLLLIVGPQFTLTVLEELALHSSAPTLDYASAFEEGVRMLCGPESVGSDAERQKQGMLYRNAYELDPSFALRKVTESLKKDGRYEEWLSRLFERDLPPPPIGATSESLRHLLKLQGHGALVVYTHCDDTLSRVTHTPAIHLDNPELAEKWAKRLSSGFLHVHGVYTEPSTVKLDCSLYDHSSTPIHPAAGVLQRELARRSTVVIGFDSHATDPLHAKFLDGFVSQSAKRHVFSIGQGVPHCLPVASQAATAVDKTVCDAAAATSSLWKEMDFPTAESEETHILGLLVAEKQGANKISKMMFSAPGVNFALMNSLCFQGQQVHTVTIRVNAGHLGTLWRWLLETEAEPLLSNSLLAVVMQDGTFVWLKGRSLTGCSSPPLFKADTIQEPAEATMETTPSNINDNTVPSIPTVGSASKASPSSPITDTATKARLVPRWRVQFKSSKLPSGGNSSRLSSLLEYQMGRGTPRCSADDSNVLMTSKGFTIPKSVLARRSSLPPMQPPQRPFAVQERDDNTLSQLASSLQNASAMEETPSYAAIKQALLCDTYKRRQSVQTDPKTLKHLLQAKTPISENEQDLVSQRRRSDPGLNAKMRDFERRKELFVDENLNWSKSCSSAIEQKISKWQRKRQAKERFEMFRKQLKGGLSYQVVANQQPPPLINHIRPTTASVPITTATGTSQVPTLMQPTTYVPGVTPFVYPQAMYAPATTAAPASTMYSSLVSPYQFVNPYSTLLTNGQATAYLIPQNTFVTGGGSPQKVVYFVPPTTSAPGGLVPSNPVTTSPAVTQLPQLAKLIAPTSAATPTVSATTTLLSPRHHHCPPDNSMTSLLSPTNSRKRYSSLPEKLTSLLRPGERPDMNSSPPPTKKHRSSEPVVYYTPYLARSPSPKGQSPSTKECHLLRTQLQQHHSSNGFNDDLDRQELEEIVGGPPHAPGVFQKDGVLQGRGHLQLWQFLLELLLMSTNSNLIEWTDNDDFEFQINRPGDVAELWGKCMNNSTMDYEKLARGIRYYFRCGILSKVSGKRLTFRYSGNVTNYIQMRRSQLGLGGEEVVVVDS